MVMTSSKVSTGNKEDYPEDIFSMIVSVKDIEE